MTNFILKIKEKTNQGLLLKIKSWSQENQIIMLFSVLGLALFFRLWQITTIPGGFSNQELETVELLKKLNLNYLWLGQDYFHGAYIYLALIWTKIFGLTVFNLRIFSAIIGSLTILLTYVFISKWFSQKIAIFTAFLFAISSFHITISRLILPEIMLPFILLLLFTLLTLAYRNKNIWLFGLSGFVLGVGFYTSPAFIFVPILFLVSGTYFFLKNKKFFTAYKMEVLVSGLGLLAALIPFIAHLIRYPMVYFTNFGFNRSISQLVMNIGQIPELLFIRTQPNFFINIGTEPLLDSFIFVTGTVGFFFALFSIARRKYFFLIFWLLFFSVYAALKRGVDIIDLIGILPVMYTFSALILDYILDKWFETFPLNKKARLLVVAIISIFFAMSTLYNFDRYFVAYKNSIGVDKEFANQAPIPLK